MNTTRDAAGDTPRDPAEGTARDATGSQRLPEGYRLLPEPPSSDEYVRMRRVTGLSVRTPEQAAGALENSWAWVSVRDGRGELAGMGRVIGDGTWYFHIADVATDPAHQRRGIGRAVMEHLIDRIDRAAPPQPYITLMADPPGQRLYRSLGFVDSAPSRGMRLPR